MILNFCREELEHGDSKISTEFELEMITAWFNNEMSIKMPIISERYKFSDIYQSENNGYTRKFEEYSSEDGSYYLRCTTFDKNNDVIKVQLSYVSARLKDIMSSGGIEDIFIDNNNDGIVDARIIQKHKVDEKGNNSEIFYDINMDGKFD